MHFARAILLIAALTACTPDTRTPAERRAAAARADSSAAGYDVGVAPPDRSSADSGRAPAPGGADSMTRDSSIRPSVSAVSTSQGAAVPTPPRTAVPPQTNPPGRPRVIAAT